MIGSADQHDIALLGDEAAAGEVFGEREPGDGELVFDRARLFLADLGREQVADDPLGLVLAFDGGRHDVIAGWCPFGPHRVKRPSLPLAVPARKSSIGLSGAVLGAIGRN